MKKIFLIMLLITVVGFTIFHQSLTIGYMADDYDLIGALDSSNYHFLMVFPAGSGSLFRPMVMLSLWAVHQLGGGNQEVLQHLTNLLIHIANACLIYIVVRSLTKRDALGLTLGLLFLLHPANVTDVYWISGRTDSLVTLFFLLSLFIAVKLFQTERFCYGLLLLLTVTCALLTKESGIAVVGVLWLIYGVFLLTREEDLLASVKRSSRSTAFLIVSTLIEAGYLAYIYSRFYVGTGRLVERSLGSMIEVAASFMLKAVYPYNEMALIQIYRNQPWLLLLAAAGIILLALLVVMMGMKSDLHSFLIFLLGGAITAVALGPFLLVLSGLGNRLIYLPLAALCISCAIWVLAYASLAKPLQWGAIILVPIFAASSYTGGKAWVANWQLTQEYCEAFRTAVKDDPAESGFLLLGWPEESGSVPIFSNDINQALYYCRYDQFGYFQNARIILPIYAENNAAWPKISVRGDMDDNPYQFELIAPPDAYYLVSPRIKFDVTLIEEYPEVRILPGLISAQHLQIAIPSDTLAKNEKIIVFDGVRFQEF